MLQLRSAIVSKLKEVDVELSEADIADLNMVGGEREEYKPATPNSIRVSTIDNYQGSHMLTGHPA